MTPQQQAAMAQAQAARAKQVAENSANSEQPTAEQQQQLETYLQQQRAIQQQMQNAIQYALTTHNLDVQRLLNCASILEAIWKMRNIEGSDEEVQKLLATSNLIYEQIDEIVTDMAAKSAARKEEERKRMEKDTAAEQPQNAPVVHTGEDRSSVD